MSENTFQFTKATKEQSKLRLALFGPSGSGKTYTALRLATGMGGKIAVIDTERGSASKYADRFTFDVLNLDNGQRTIESYIQAIEAAQKAGYEILIVDSLTHAWRELLAEMDRLASRFGGNKWAAWSKGTPKQRSFVDAILDYDGHIIATMRSKTAWETTKDDRGKIKPLRIGLDPVQGKGIEYEFDLLGELSIDHVMVVSKDRTGKFQDRVIEKPGEEMGQELMEWLKEGAPPKPRKETKVSASPSSKPPSPTRAKLEKRWDDLWHQAITLGLNPDDLPTVGPDDTNAELTAAGKKLAAIVKAAKSKPAWDAEVITAVLQAELSENNYSAVNTLKQSNLTPSTPTDVVVMWFRQYRASRDAGGDSGEAAIAANAWLDSEIN